MSGVTVEKGSMALQGQLHAYLEAIGVDYAVLRPTFFWWVLVTGYCTVSNHPRNQLNFLYGWPLEWPLLKTTDEITTATTDGKIGFISENDIADIAVQFLTSQKLFEYMTAFLIDLKKGGKKRGWWNVEQHLFFYLHNLLNES